MMQPEPQPYRDPCKIILFLDGTAKKPDNRATNVFSLYKLLAVGPSESSTQLRYYQPGIGSPVNASIVPKLLDIIFARSLKDQVKSAYKFIVDNYDYSRKDKIYLFGYSRGAHTAHALAHMIAKVGLVPRGNHQLIDTAYEFYKGKGRDNDRLCENFKNSHATYAEIEFMGLWDTVSSVGLTFRRLPFTRSNLHCKKFRHALSLDERRYLFQPDTFQDTACEVLASLNSSALSSNPPHNCNVNEASGNSTGNGQSLDVKEVWFAGCHGDVGGGSQPFYFPFSHSYISLRWMIQECAHSQGGLKFQETGLVKLCMDSTMLDTSTDQEQDPISPDVFQSAFDVLLSTLKRKHWLFPKWDWDIETDIDGNMGNQGDPQRRLLEAELRDSLMPIDDAIKNLFLWRLLGTHSRHSKNSDSKHRSVHRTVKWRQDAWKWVESPNCNPKYKAFAKQLGLANYKPRAQINN